MKSKHRNWKIEKTAFGTDVIFDDRANICSMTSGSSMINLANAKLIAAAPELLKALELIMSNSTDHAIIRIASKAINKAL